MHIEFLVEEPSAEVALHNLVPKIVGLGVSYNVHVFQGKMDLMKNLPNRLRGYRSWLPDSWRIVVLVDEDREGCLKLKEQLEKIASNEGLITRSVAGPGGSFQVINRLAIEELEAWFFGDVTALRIAYPKVPIGLDRRKPYRNPDAIQGGTWQALERILKNAGYYRGGLPKKEAARRISEHMDPTRNTSKSFQVFRNALQELVI
jgi:hypothetical protein